MNFNPFKKFLNPNPAPSNQPPQESGEGVESKESEIKKASTPAMVLGFIAMSLNAFAGPNPAPGEVVKFSGYSSPEKNRSLAKEIEDKYGSRVSVTFTNTEAKTDAEKGKGYVRSFESDGRHYEYSEEYMQDSSVILIRYLDNDRNGSVDQVLITKNGTNIGGMDLDNGAGKVEVNNTSSTGTGNAQSNPFQGDSKKDKAQTDADSAFGQGLELIKSYKDSKQVPANGPELAQN